MDFSKEHISREEIQEIIDRIYHVPIRRLTLYQRAFVHKSIFKYINPQTVELDYLRESNEKLELIGDSVLDLSVILYLVNKYPEDNEGQLSQKRIRIVKGKTLHVLAKKIGFEGKILMTNHVRNGPNENLLEDAFEAFIAAIFLDHGQVIADKFIVSLIEKHIEPTFIEKNDNYKDILNHKFSSNTPEYKIVKEVLKENKKEFTIAVYIYGKLYGKGTANKKKDAEQKAAKFALQYLNII